jgi:hypothetical protein
LWGASSGQQQPAGDGVVTVCAYLALLLAGAVQALLGSFLFSLGPAPLASVFFDLAILATCALGAWGMGSAGGAVLPAGGWLVVALVLSSVSAGGTVIVTNSMAGQWFLFGGALCAVVGALIGSVWTARLGRSRGQRR